MRSSFAEKLKDAPYTFSNLALNKAIIFPDEVELDKEKPYPRPSELTLMHNPF